MKVETTIPYGELKIYSILLQSYGGGVIGEQM